MDAREEELVRRAAGETVVLAGIGIGWSAVKVSVGRVGSWGGRCDRDAARLAQPRRRLRERVRLARERDHAVVEAVRRLLRCHTAACVGGALDV